MPASRKQQTYQGSPVKNISESFDGKFRMEQVDTSLRETPTALVRYWVRVFNCLPGDWSKNLERGKSCFIVTCRYIARNKPQEPLSEFVLVIVSGAGDGKVVNHCVVKLGIFYFVPLHSDPSDVARFSLF